MENMEDFCVSHNYTQRDLICLPSSFSSTYSASVAVALLLMLRRPPPAPPPSFSADAALADAALADAALADAALAALHLIHRRHLPLLNIVNGF
jgi:hypothetical protein